MICRGDSVGWFFVSVDHFSGLLGVVWRLLAMVFRLLEPLLRLLGPVLSPRRLVQPEKWSVEWENRLVQPLKLLRE